MRRTNLDLLDGSDALRRCLDTGNLALDWLGDLRSGDALHQGSQRHPFRLCLGFGFGDSVPLYFRLGLGDVSFGVWCAGAAGNAEFRLWTGLGNSALGLRLRLGLDSAHLGFWYRLRLYTSHLGSRFVTIRLGLDLRLDSAHLGLSALSYRLRLYTSHPGSRFGITRLRNRRQLRWFNSAQLGLHLVV